MPGEVKIPRPPQPLGAPGADGPEGPPARLAPQPVQEQVRALLVTVIPGEDALSSFLITVQQFKDCPGADCCENQRQ